MREITIPLFLYILMLIVCFGDVLAMILSRIDKTLEKKIKLVKEKWVAYYLEEERKEKDKKK